MPKNNKQQIEIKNSMEAVRLRRNMYLPNKDHAVFEILDNAIDEHAAGRCDHIKISIIGDRITVQDNGQGIPISIPYPTMKEIEENKIENIGVMGLTEAEIAYTSLHAGGKFSDDGAYKTSGGLHGVGAAVTNALSEKLTLTSMREGGIYTAKFSKGKITQRLTKVGETDETGTIISFILDDEVWEDEELNRQRIDRRVKQMSFLNPGLTLDLVYTKGRAVLEDKNSDMIVRKTYSNKDGIKDYIEELTTNKKVLSDIIELDTEVDGIKIHCAFSYTDSYNETMLSFCNNINTEGGGDHLIGFRQSINKAISSYIDSHNVKMPDYKPDDTREGVVGIVSVKIPQPDFDGQGKAKLNAPKLRSIIRDAVEEAFLDYLDKNPDTAKVILDKVEGAAKARQAARRARDNARKAKKLIEGGDPEGLANCSSKKPEECEIYLVEGKRLSCPNISFPVIAGV